tara:strand:+ start:258 stop:479 length:222 start_codon:yes stop_codon:yes gene_type:complete
MRAIITARRKRRKLLEPQKPDIEKEAEKDKKDSDKKDSDKKKKDYNEYAVCTESVGSTAGTTERSEWESDDKQ